MRAHARLGLLATILLASLGTGCVHTAAGTGNFEQALTVTGPVALEIENGAGSVRISSGSPGQVRVHGEFTVNAWLWETARRDVEQVKSHPPIEQRGNTIRVGYVRDALRNLRVNYTVVVPEETELRAGVGSGSLEIQAIRGPASLSAGSGRIRAERIGDDAQASVGSGSIQLADVRGRVHFSAGSGNITLENVGGEIRGNAGSGDITINQPGNRVAVETGSGGIHISGASADLRISTGSGKISVEGNPASQSFWEIQSRSGGVSLKVPPAANFRLHARSRSGGIVTDIPIVIEEQTRRELRARVGQGGARVELESGSGGIHLR